MTTVTVGPLWCEHLTPVSMMLGLCSSYTISFKHKLIQYITEETQCRLGHLREFIPSFYQKEQKNPQKERFKFNSKKILVQQPASKMAPMILPPGTHGLVDSSPTLLYGWSTSVTELMGMMVCDLGDQVITDIFTFACFLLDQLLQGKPIFKHPQGHFHVKELRPPILTSNVIQPPCLTILILVNSYFTLCEIFKKDFTYLFLELMEWVEKKGERNIDVREKY